MPKNVIFSHPALHGENASLIVAIMAITYRLLLRINMEYDQLSIENKQLYRVIFVIFSTTVTTSRRFSCLPAVPQETAIRARL